MQVSFDGKLATIGVDPSVYVLNKKENNRIGEKGFRYLSKATWISMKTLWSSNFCKIQVDAEEETGAVSG